jgi:hypothetical protein
MALETLDPNPMWMAEAYSDTVEILEEYSDDVTYKIWCGDWCKDCRAKLPDFGAALAAAGVPDHRIEEFELDQDKRGPGVEEYDVESIPTVVVEHAPRSGATGASGEDAEPRPGDGDEVARFVENESAPIAVYLADRLAETLGHPDEQPG